MPLNALDAGTGGAPAPRSYLEAGPSLIELLPIAAYACDAKGRILWFNRRASLLWGRLPRIGDDSELYGGSHRVTSDSRSSSWSETLMAEVLRTGVPIHGVEALVERPDGSATWVAVHIDVVIEDGRVAGAINCFHETTRLHHALSELDSHRAELGRAREEVSAGERRYRDILEALPATIYTTDADGKITYFNRAAAELSGREPQIGVDDWCITHRLYRPDGTPLPHDECPMAIALKQDRPVRDFDIVAERPDGSRAPILPYPTPLHDAAGGLLGAVNMLVDISERKKAEAEQQLLLRELNHRVKNNMQMLHSLLATAERECSGGEARDALSDATRRVAAMASAQQVLYASAGGMSFPAREFIEAVCAGAQPSFPAGVAIDCEVASGDLSNDMALPLALILSELLTNAVTHAGGAKDAPIRVGLTEEMLYVEDGGTGFAVAEARRRGSGLGLVRGLAAQLGARFDVERPGGARCVVRFADASHVS